MLFLTNRAVQEGLQSEVGRKITFDLNHNSPGNSVYYCNRDSRDNYREIGSKDFLTQLKNSNYREILLYIHGFSNLPEPNVFPRVEGLQKLFDETSKGLVLVVPMIWPCDNDFGVVKDYWDDQKAADASAISFSRVLDRFMDWRSEAANQTAPCLKRINILAHSMGNRVFRETMRAWNKYSMGGNTPLLFRNSFLVAADVVNESLEVGGSGETICHASRNVCVYFASDDLALRSSKVSNLKNRVASRRLGHTGPENMGKVPKNVYSFDCDNFNNTYDNPIGHGYFIADQDGGPGKVFTHIHRTIKSGRAFPGEENRRGEIL